MKQGRSLTDWAAEIERQASSKKDFVANTQALAIIPKPNGVTLEVGRNGEFGVTEHTHSQIATRLKIHKPYYDRMLKEQPRLLAENVNTWFHEAPEKRMVRTLDGRARAFMSDRYRRLDNSGLAEVLLPELMGRGDVELASCEITESRLYLKMVLPKMVLEVKKGDPVRSGFVITNSEIGMGQISAAPFIDRLVCENGMILTEWGARKRHVGRSAESEEEAYELYEDATLKADDTAFFLKVRDTVRAMLTEARFKLIVERFQQAAAMKIEGDPLEAVEVVAAKYAFAEDEKSSFLKHLINGGDLSAYGVAQAITRTSQDVEAYDRASELERVGGEIITLGPGEWKTIAAAA